MKFSSTPIRMLLAISLASCSLLFDEEKGGLGVDDAAIADGRFVDGTDARPIAVDAAPPIDAMPVECMGDEDCAMPLNLCLSSGRCNLVTNICSFSENVECPPNETCKNNTCDPNTGECASTPANEAAVCLAQSCTPSGDCQFDSNNSCDETGTQNQNCSESICSSGDCVAVVTTETVGCSRDTDNDMCGATICGFYGECENFASDCGELGMRSRSCTEQVCSSGTCGGVDRLESESCTRADTQGDRCGISLTCGVNEDGITDLCCSSNETCDVECGGCEQP